MKIVRPLALALALAASTTFVTPLVTAQLPPQEGVPQGQRTPEESLFQNRIAGAIRLYKDGKTEEAISTFEALNAENAKSPEVQSWLGFLYIRSNQPARAVPLLEAASTTNPDDLEVLNNLGNAYLMTGNDAAALVKFERLAKLNPRMFEPHYNAGNIYLGQKNWNRAAAEYRAAAAIKGDNPSVWNNLGVALDASGDDKGATDAFRRASDLSPKNGVYARNAGLGYAKMKSADATTYLERAVANGSSDGTVLVTLGSAYTASGQYEKAQNVYGRASAQYNDDASYWYNLGVLRSRTKDLAGSEEAYRRAAELRPEDVDTLQNYGLVLFKRGKYGLAREQFAAVRRLDPTSVAARRNFAAAAAKSGRVGDAVPIWRETVRTEPENLLVRTDLANALYASGDYEGARYHYKQVLARKSNSAEALNGIGLLYLRDYKLPAAETSFRSAIAGDPRFTPAYNNLAIVLEKLNKKPQAIALLERAAKIDPTNADVQKNLRRLRADA